MGVCARQPQPALQVADLGPVDARPDRRLILRHIRKLALPGEVAAELLCDAHGSSSRSK
jgi:hypothetical protein